VSEELAPGFYWIQEDGRRVPAEWTGKQWWGIAMQRPYLPEEISDPIPALPPAENIPSK
jgi:hypothetical protein